ncbi:hypothetical protein GU700_22220 [Methylobacterium sp. NI91]|nr:MULTISPECIES: hypothetical protein [unclassified Methylobacterium]QIJ77044.1 hypothetical protein CLZ_22225 [Methylobacterium sp. CLZ]QIJ81947.1 hypothetical protein GU700_22220 [Methylobacterium sp. NI91]
MEALRLPVLRTVKLAVKDSINIISRMPILCLLALLAAVLFKLIEEIVLGPALTGEASAQNTLETYLIDIAEYTYVVPLAVFSCRFVILGRTATWREALRIKDILIAYGTVSIVFATAIFLPLLILKSNPDQLDAAVSMIFLTAFLISLSILIYWAIRWSLIYPAIAVDQIGASLQWSARTTKGIAWRVFITNATIPVIFSALLIPFLIEGYVDQIGRWSILLTAFASVSSNILFAAVASEIYLWCRANRESCDVSAPRAISVPA